MFAFGKQTLRMDITTGAEHYPINLTGSVMLFKDEPIHFVMNGLTFSVVCKYEKSVEKAKFETKLLSDDHLEMTLTNFTAITGSSTYEPFQLMIIDGRQVYLNWAIYAIHGTDSLFPTLIFHYTFYTREEVKNEQ